MPRGEYRDKVAARSLALRELEYAAAAVATSGARRQAAIVAALEAGATQAEVAKVLGVTRQAVSKAARTAARR